MFEKPGEKLIEIPEQGAAFFASDLHLCADTPKTLDAFENWLANVSQPHAQVFLLGDLFEVWFGDDHEDEVTDRVSQATQAAHAAGARVFFMHGNRDFLLGETYAEQAQIEILPDPEFLLVNHQVVLITHGDQLCTDDRAYQKFRQQSRDEKWQTNFLSQDLQKRKEIAFAMRAESKAHKAKTTMAIMDVNQQAVEQAFKGKWPDGYFIGKSNVLLHGHTHRCAVHEQGQTTSPATQSQVGELKQGQRIVLPDWDFDHPREQSAKGGFLKLTPDGQFQLTLFN